MKWTLAGWPLIPPHRKGNNGKPLASDRKTEHVSTPQQTALEKTTAAAKTILDDEAALKLEKSERLKAAREARDKAKS